MKRSTWFKKRSVDIDKWVAQFPKAKVWLAKLQDKDTVAFNLWRYCQWSQKNPDQLLELKEDTKSREAEFLLDRFVADKSLDLTDHAKYSIVSAVRSFYMHNYADLAKQSGIIYPMKVKPYNMPTKQGLRKLWNAGYNPRDRSLISFVTSTAIARETLTHVKFSHLEKNWRQQENPHISLESSIIKGHGKGKYRNVRQETFLTGEAKTDLIEYIEWMKQVRGFKFNDDSEIFRKIKKPYDALTYGELGFIAKRLSEKSGVPFTWHDGRRFVETALEEARIHPNWCRKIRGRKVKGKEAPYSRPKIQQLRQAYKGAVQFLQFRTEQVSEIDREIRQVEISLIPLVQGGQITQQAADAIMIKVRASKKPIDSFAREMSKALKELKEEDCQKIVDEQELEQWLTQGWRVVTTLPSSKVVIEGNNNHS